MMVNASCLTNPVFVKFYKARFSKTFQPILSEITSPQPLLQAMFALKALNGVVPGFEKAKLRNFGSTIGTRDSRKIMMIMIIIMMIMMIMMMMMMMMMTGQQRGPHC